MSTEATPRPLNRLRSEPRADAARAPRSTNDLLLWLGVAVNVAVALTARHFPYQDGANHLARYVLLDQAWFGTASAEIHARWLPTSYIAVDALGAVLVHLIGPDLALRAIVVLALVLLPGGMYLLLRQTASERRGWALVGVLLGLSWYLLDGLLNFVIGAALAFIWLACWWPRRDSDAWLARCALVAGAAGLFLVHLSAPLAVLVVVWTDWGLAIVAWLRSPGGHRPRVRARALTSILTAVAVLALWAWVELAIGQARPGESALEFRSATEKLLTLGAPFYSFSLTQALVLATGWAVSLTAFLFINRADLRFDAIVVSSIAFLALAAISPRSVGAAGGVDVRWLLFAYLLPFCATSEGRPRAQRAGIWLVLLASLVHAGVVHRSTRARDRMLDDVDRVLSLLPDGTRLLPIVADGNAHPRVGTYNEYAYWHVIRKAGRVPGLFNFDGTRPGDARFTHFAHFEVRAQPYMPPYEWGTATFTPLDWARIGDDYDYILQAGSDARVTRELERHAGLRHREGAITLYEVHPSR